MQKYKTDKLLGRYFRKRNRSKNSEVPKNRDKIYTTIGRQLQQHPVSGHSYPVTTLYIRACVYLGGDDDDRQLKIHTRVRPDKLYRQ